GQPLYYAAPRAVKVRKAKRARVPAPAIAMPAPPVFPLGCTSGKPTADRRYLSRDALALLEGLERACGAQDVRKTCCPGCRMTFSPSHLSKHATGDAFDVAALGRKRVCVLAWLKAQRRGAVLTYREKRLAAIVHADLGPVMIRRLGEYEGAPFVAARDLPRAPAPVVVTPAPPASPTKAEEAARLALYTIDAEIRPARPIAAVRLALADVPLASPRVEINRAAALFGVSAKMMEAFAKIESDFDPRQRTGSYKGLFQLSDAEFAKYGEGDIYNARDNALAGAFKFASETREFEIAFSREPSFPDLYLIHQQGREGAAQHLARPDRVAWRSMCETSEGRDKGPRWCRKAIWGNVPQTFKRLIAGGVEALTSGQFVEFWTQRVLRLAQGVDAPAMKVAAVHKVKIAHKAKGRRHYARHARRHLALR